MTLLIPFIIAGFQDLGVWSLSAQAKYLIRPVQATTTNGDGECWSMVPSDWSIKIINRLGVAGAVLQSPLLLSNSLSE